MEIETMPLADLVPDPKNSRLHPEENITAIMNSLSNFGQVLPLVVHAETRVVVGGNGTMEAMTRLGWDSAEVTLYDGPMEKAKALAIALNRTGELAQWDADQLVDTLAELQDVGMDHEALGFSMASLEVMFPAPSTESFRIDRSEMKKSDPREKEEKDPEPEIEYRLLFDTKDQQKRFMGFVKWLKAKYSKEKSTAARLDIHIQEQLASATKPKEGKKT